MLGRSLAAVCLLLTAAGAAPAAAHVIDAPHWLAAGGGLQQSCDRRTGESAREARLPTVER
jgi:hypothetical protein